MIFVLLFSQYSKFVSVMELKLADIPSIFKSVSMAKKNDRPGRKGVFWWTEYFLEDRRGRNLKHWRAYEKRKNEQVLARASDAATW